jgi:hypothetical protein
LELALADKSFNHTTNAYGVAYLRFLQIPFGSGEIKDQNLLKLVYILY